MALPHPHRLGPIVRTRMARGLTRLGKERSARLFAALPPLERWLSAGTYQISGGLPLGLRIAGATLPLDQAQSFMVVRGTVEQEVQEALRRTLSPGDVVHDIGANLGFMALLAARMVGPAGRVVAFEPVPHSAAGARRNAELNGFSQLEVREEAVAAADGRVELAVVADASWSFLAERADHPLTAEVLEVASVTIDRLVADGEVPPPNLVKVDVEGAEGDVLRGMAETMRTARPTIVCELHDTNDEVADLLEAAGYSLENLNGPAPVRAAGAVHVLARPL
ncbi:MAG: FkbM family methyltransferase [Thermoleophilaceae bacterium]